MSDRHEMRDLLAPDRAREVLAELEFGAGSESVPLTEATGRILAESVDATLDVPGFDRASVDGYALRASDTTGAGEVEPATLSIVGTVRAGETPTVTVGEGEAAEVATGAVVPDGADAVVMVEDTDERGEVVDVRTAVPPGGNVMAAGTDIAAGDRALGPGVALSPRTVGLLAALGTETVDVRRPPRVAVVSTGEELVQPGDALDHDAGQIYDVNTATLSTAVREAGGEPVRYTRVSDDRAALTDALTTAAAECDLVLTSGSTSAGAADMLYDVVDEEGELLVHGIAIKPGRPTVVGRVDGTPYVGLPGYPVSALSVFRLFVAPRVRDAAGIGTAEATTTGRLVLDERYDEGRHRALPVGLVTDGDGDTLVYPVDRGSGATTTLAVADGVVEMGASTQLLAAGTEVTVDLFAAGGRPPALLAVGESDPVANRLLSDIERTRFLPDGTRAGRRWLRDDIADVAVVTGDADGVSGEVLASWHREWGVVVPGTTGENGDDPLAVLVDDENRVATVNHDLGLREAVDDALTDAGHDPSAVGGIETAGIESPARRVADGRADAGVGLRHTARQLGLTFLGVGEQRVSLVGNKSRGGKRGLQQLRESSDALGAVPADLEGYRS